MSLKFTKRKEDFVCERCGEDVKGGGYTNHCPKCFFSKHVDVYPGDRAEECGGLMEPVGLEQKSREFVVLHRCLKCGKENRNKVSPTDDLEQLILIIKNKINKNDK